MFFSTPDINNLFLADSKERFFNPVWYPYFARKTHMEKLTFPSSSLFGGKPPTDMWMLEQAIGFLNISVNIRMTAVRLEDGSILVHNPIAPTGECLDMVRSLGDVKHIVLGSTALEHKFFCRSFVDKFPQASFYACPGVFNYVPGLTNLMPAGLGLFVDLVRPIRIDGWLTNNFQQAILNGVTYPASPVPPWAREIEHELLFFDAPQFANAAEAALFHKRSKTLLVTDSLTYISSTKTDWITETGARDRRAPFNLYPKEWSPARKKAMDQMQIYTIQTPYKDEDFDKLTDKLYVCPQLRLFVYETDPELARSWVKRVLRWDVKRIIPSHFDAPVECSNKDILKAFSFIFDRQNSQQDAPLPDDHCLGVQKAVQILLRRSLFRDRLQSGKVQKLEYAQVEEGGRETGLIELPLIGLTKV